MKEIKDFKDIQSSLFDISECPNFSDEMRNFASSLYYYIRENSGFEIIIKPSGKTWICQGEGVDYIAVDPGYKDCTSGEMLGFFRAHLLDLDNPKGLEYFKPISEINFEDVSDDIVQFNPKVLFENRIHTLWGVKSNWCLVEEDSGGDVFGDVFWVHLSNTYIAGVSDLA